MKLAVKSAWMCASGVFLITAMPPFFESIAGIGLSSIPTGTLQSMKIIETLIFSLIGAIMAGSIGYIIGDILSHPQGNLNPEGTTENPPEENSLQETADESFLADLETPPKLAIPEHSELNMGVDPLESEKNLENSEAG